MECEPINTGEMLNGMTIDESETSKGTRHSLGESFSLEVEAGPIVGEEPLEVYPAVFLIAAIKKGAVFKPTN